LTADESDSGDCAGDLWGVEPLTVSSADTLCIDLAAAEIRRTVTKRIRIDEFTAKSSLSPAENL
jgi:hypothetical protein